MFNLNMGLIAGIFSDEASWGETPWFDMAPWYVIVPAIIAVCAIAYLLGSINSAIIISKIFFGEDVRTKGSGNAGTTNMLRNYGKGAALGTLIGDMLKTALSIVIAGIVFGFGYAGAISVSEMCYVAGMFSIIGHIFPIYYGFKGGKGVLSTATMVLILSPVVFLILITVFIAVVAFSKYVSLGSVLAASLFPVVLNGAFEMFESKIPGLMALSSILLAILIVWCHRANLVRISNRTESKLSFGKKQPKEEVEPEEDAPRGYGDEE